MTETTDRALLTITAVGGADGRRPMLMGVVAQAGVGFFYGHLDRWCALFDNRHLDKPVRLRDARVDTFDDSGVVTREGKVDVLARVAGAKLTLYYGDRVGQTIRARQDVGLTETYRIDPDEFETFAKACRLIAHNERGVQRLVAEITQQRRLSDSSAMVVDVDL